MPVGFLPEQFEVSSGLATDFEGVVIESLVEVYEYEGKNKPRTCVTVKVMPRPGTDIPLQNQHYSASNPDVHMPSLDGRPKNPSPTGGTRFSYMGELGLDKTTGQYTVEKGLPSGSNYAHFVECFVGCLQAAGAPLDRLATGDVRAAFRGIKGYWTRIPQKDRNIKDDKKTDAGDRKKDILVLTRFDGYATEEEIAQLTALANANAGSAATPGQMPVPGQVAGPVGYNPAAAAYNPAAAMPAAAPIVYPAAPQTMAPATFPPYVAQAPQPAAPPAAFAPYTPPAAGPAPAALPPSNGLSPESVQTITGVVVEKLRAAGGTVARPTLAIGIAVDSRIQSMADRGALLSFVSTNEQFWQQNQFWLYDPATQNVTLRG